MIGDCVAAGHQVTAAVRCGGGQNKTYIVEQMKIRPQGDNAVAATQPIGWEPIPPRLGSYPFDSQDGSTAGMGTNDANGWTVKGCSVLPDGEPTSAMTVIQPQ